MQFYETSGVLTAAVENFATAAYRTDKLTGSHASMCTQICAQTGTRIRAKISRHACGTQIQAGTCAFTGTDIHANTCR